MRTRREVSKYNYSDFDSKEKRKELIELPLNDRLEMSFDVIRTALRNHSFPYVSLSGGIHSCITAFLVNKVSKTTPALFNDWGIMSPMNHAEKFCKEFTGRYGMPLVIERSGFNMRDFTKQYGFPIFKAVRSFVPHELWDKYRITDACRKAKRICRSKFHKEYDCDLLFTGIMCDESAMRMQNFLKYGYFMPESGDGISVCKPLIHFRQGETMQIVHKYNIHIARWANVNVDGEFDEETYVKSPTLFECALCGHDFKKKGFGKLGLMYRAEKALFMEYWGLGLGKSFKDMAKDFPNQTHLKSFVDCVEGGR